MPTSVILAAIISLKCLVDISSIRAVSFVNFVSHIFVLGEGKRRSKEAPVGDNVRQTLQQSQL